MVHLNRRTFLIASATLCAAPRAAVAQQGRIYTIAILEEASVKARPHDWEVLRDRLRELGIAEGKNAVFVFRFADGKAERLPQLATELVAGEPHVIVCPGTASTRAALRATGTIPIIFLGTGEPVGTGLAASLSRPGGNATGFSTMASGNFQKALELLGEVVPGIRRAAYLSDTANPSAMVVYSRLEESARKLKISIRMLDVVGPSALERSFATIRQERTQGLIVGTSGPVLDFRNEIVQFAAREKIPTVYGRSEFVVAGGLLSYGIDRKPLYVRAAGLIQRILKGARPSDIPVEQIAVFRMVLNLKTARALGLVIPDSIRVRVDEVIE